MGTGLYLQKEQERLRTGQGGATKGCLLEPDFIKLPEGRFRVPLFSLAQSEHPANYVGFKSYLSCWFLAFLTLSSLVQLGLVG